MTTSEPNQTSGDSHVPPDEVSSTAHGSQDAFELPILSCCEITTDRAKQDFVLRASVKNANDHLQTHQKFYQAVVQPLEHLFALSNQIALDKLPEVIFEDFERLADELKEHLEHADEILIRLKKACEEENLQEMYEIESHELSLHYKAIGECIDEQSAYGISMLQAAEKLGEEGLISMGTIYGIDQATIDSIQMMLEEDPDGEVEEIIPPLPERFSQLISSIQDSRDFFTRLFQRITFTPEETTLDLNEAISAYALHIDQPKIVLEGKGYELDIPGTVFHFTLSSTISGLTKLKTEVISKFSEELGSDDTFFSALTEDAFRAHPNAQQLQSVMDTDKQITLAVPATGEVVMTLPLPIPFVDGLQINPSSIAERFNHLDEFAQLYDQDVQYGFEKNAFVVKLFLKGRMNGRPSRSEGLSFIHQAQIDHEDPQSTSTEQVTLIRPCLPMNGGGTPSRNYSLAIPHSFFQSETDRETLADILPEADRFMTCLQHFDQISLAKGEHGDTSLVISGDHTRLHEEKNQSASLVSLMPDVPQPIEKSEEEDHRGIVIYGLRTPKEEPVDQDYHIAITREAFIEPGILNAIAELDKQTDILYLPLSIEHCNKLSKKEHGGLYVMQNILSHLTNIVNRVETSHPKLSRTQLQLFPIMRSGFLGMGNDTCGYQFSLMNQEGEIITTGTYDSEIAGFQYVDRNPTIVKRAAKAITEALAGRDLEAEYYFMDSARALQEANLRIPNILLQSLCALHKSGASQEIVTNFLMEDSDTHFSEAQNGAISIRALKKKDYKQSKPAF